MNLSIPTAAQCRHARPAALLLNVFLLLSACGDGSGGGSDSTSTSAASSSASGASLQAASVVRALEVPEGLAGEPFDGARTLTVPPGFGIRLWARVPKARFMALAPNGDVLVSVPSEGRIVLLRPGAGVPPAFDYASGLQNPHDMVFHRIGDITYLYVAESNRVTRSIYRSGETGSGERQVVVDGLPDNSTPDLLGRYGHQLKNIALSADNKLYLSIASACNACTEDTQSDPLRGAIYQYNADGSGRRLYASGLRNAEGLDFIPGTNTLWAAVNQRDEIRVPFDVDIDGDGESDLGKILPAYVDDNPPEQFTVVRDSGHYGWPFCNPVPNAAMSNLDMRPDHDLNRNGSSFDCAGVVRSSKGIVAHAAPLGFSFLHASNVPAAWRNGAVVALHGCWNCTTLRAGYKVVYFPFDGSGNAGAEIDLVSGFVTDPEGRAFWGRPVDAIADGRGGILISDDHAGAIYQLYPEP